MERSLFALSLGLAGLLLAPTPAPAQQQCGQHDVVVRQLAAQFGEARRGMGLTGNGTVMELFASADTGTWTVAITLPDGLTCLLAVGADFQADTVPQVAKDDPA